MCMVLDLSIRWPFLIEGALIPVPYRDILFNLRNPDFQLKSMQKCCLLMPYLF